MKEKNIHQIVRKDGSKCFVEVMGSSFPIGKVLFNFNAYDQNAAAGSKITANVAIYLSFDEFYRICHDLTISCVLLKEILKMKNDAETAGQKYPPQKVLSMGGKSAESLAAANQSRADGMSLSRQLKISSGTKFPVLLQAESGPGEKDEKGLIVPRYRTPEQKIMIPFSYETLKELFLITKAHVDAYIASKYTYMILNPAEFAYKGKENNSSNPNTKNISYPSAPKNNVAPPTTNNYSQPNPTVVPQSTTINEGNSEDDDFPQMSQEELDFFMSMT